MSVDLDRQLHEYCSEMDARQGALSVQDILDRAEGVPVIPRTSAHQPSPRAKWIAAVAAVLVMVAILIGIRVLPTTDQTPDPVDQETTTTVASDPGSPEAQGWPSTFQNPAGLYSFDGSKCAGQSCSVGVMHNGYGSDDIYFRFVAIPWPSTDNRYQGTAVTVAGRDGLYRRVDELNEQWIVLLGDWAIIVRLEAEPDTSQTDLDEAYAIIDSMRTEPKDQPKDYAIPYRLVFTLTTDNWDSG